MFHRRLSLLGVVMVVVLAVLVGQMFHLSVIQGGERRAVAEARLASRTYLPTVRGPILDRHGRVLAFDVPCYDIAVNYDVISGTWVRLSATTAASREMGRAKFRSLTREEREAAVAMHEPRFRAHCDDLWSVIRQLGGLTNEELQERLDEIKRSVQSTAADVWERQRESELAKYGDLEDGDAYTPAPIREQRIPHVILPGISDEQAFEFSRMQSQFPDMFEVQDSHRREYPWLTVDVPLDRSSLPRSIRADDRIVVRTQGVADHILGGIRNGVWAEDIARRPFVNPQTGEIDPGGYRPGDRVGSRGFELIFEASLRGTRGILRECKDSLQSERTEPVAGRALTTTLDIALQARIQAILSKDFGLTLVQPWQQNHALPLGKSLNSAAVVLEVETGDIVSMVSMPTLAMGEELKPIERIANGVWVNRPVEAVYPPGSILKPLVFSAAVMEGLHTIESRIQCTGHYFENNKDRARCWIYRDKYGLRTHEALQGDEAIARSCNIFFYTLGDHLGIDRLCSWLRWFGMGGALNIGLLHGEPDAEGHVTFTGENGGELPRADGRGITDIPELRRSGQAKFAQVIMGIGQGPMTWTPVQAANAYAQLARGGIVRDATLVVDDPRGSRPPPQAREDRLLTPALVDMALEGLRRGVAETYGTSHHISYEDGSPAEPIINATGVTVWAKTGTAQAPPLREQDTNKDGQINAKDEPTYQQVDHAWFVGLVGPEGSTRPLFAIAVIVEYGGSGGRTAGPIANQIVRALQAEGYLPRGEEPIANEQHAPSVEEPEPGLESEESATHE